MKTVIWIFDINKGHVSILQGEEIITMSCKEKNPKYRLTPTVISTPKITYHKQYLMNWLYISTHTFSLKYMFLVQPSSQRSRASPTSPIGELCSPIWMVLEFHT